MPTGLLRRLAIAFSMMSLGSEARVIQLDIEHREPVLNQKHFGLAGAYEKLSGKARFALDPAAAVNAKIVDLGLAPRNAKGEVEFTADFMLIEPVDAKRGNGRLLYEVGNRGGKALLRVFQKGTASADPVNAADFGDGALMNQGYSLLWMGWQWDVPEGRMRMDMPVASDHGAPITGLVRGNFVPNAKSMTGPLTDRGHRAYPVNDRADPEAFLTVRDRPLDAPQQIPRKRWHFVDDATVTLEGGFELGRIYDVVYRARDPRVLGCGLAGTRDLISFLKHRQDGTIRFRFAYGWGVSQSGRFLRHFLYEGFNQDEQGRQVFDGLIDEVGGAGRGSFNHRFGQASRDAEQFFNIQYPVDLFPFTDSPETDPETGVTDSLLGRAEAARVAPKLFHILSNSEYFNRAGSLIHTDPAGTRDIDPPANARIYTIASGPHYFGPFPPGPTEGLAAPLSPLDRGPVVRALLKALDAWVVDGAAPPASRYPRISDGTLTAAKAAGWPVIPGVHLLPPPMLMTYRLDFGPDFVRKGLVTNEPPKIGKAYVGLVPAVDEDGNARAGIRMPQVAAPIATYTGWNFRTPEIGSSDQLNGEAGSFFPFAATKADRVKSRDSRRSVEERYTSREQYLGKVMAVARELVAERLWLAEDLPALVDEALLEYDWAAARGR